MIELDEFDELCAKETRRDWLGSLLLGTLCFCAGVFAAMIVMAVV